MLADLARRNELVRVMVDAGARPTLRTGEPGYAGLAKIIVGQQVSVASARAIWNRVAARFEPFDHADILAASDEDLRACGLSAPKMRTLRAIASALNDGSLDVARLDDLPAQEAHAQLVTVKGIGPWTADIYLLFCLGHGDAFPAGDLALQEAARLAGDLADRPTAPALVEIAEPWRPWRGAVAKLLWSYYAVRKERQGVVLADN